MRKSRAALGSAAFVVVAPGTVVGLIPWLITYWEVRHTGPYWWMAQVVGVVLICVGLVPAVSAFVEFVKAGGTPMPIAPTQRLVITGFNRYLRNPMYFGLVLVILGQALLFASLRLLVYATVAWAVPASFVRWYEEPALARQFGAEYETYRDGVPAWWPRLRPWTPNGHGTPEPR